MGAPGRGSSSSFSGGAVGTFTLDVAGVRQLDVGISRMVRAVDDMRPFWPAFQQAFQQAEREQFASQGAAGAAGSWAALSPAYARWKASRYPGKPILRRTDALYAALTGNTGATIYEAEPQQLVLGAAITYGMYHQRGTSRMPARPPISLATGQQVYFGRALGKMARELGHMWSVTGR